MSATDPEPSEEAINAAYISWAGYPGNHLLAGTTKALRAAYAVDLPRIVAERDKAIAERDRLAREVEQVLTWVEEQQLYCRPAYMQDTPDEELDVLRGPCAAYGDVVYGLVARRLREALGEGAPASGPKP